MLNNHINLFSSDKFSKFLFIDLCNLCELGDEFHYLFKCTFFSDERKTLLPKDVIARPNVVKYRELLCSDDRNSLFKLS